MSRGPANPFESLEPPRGGLAALRARIERDSAKRLRRRRRWSLAMVTSVPLALLAVMLALSPRPRQALPERFHWARVAAGLDAAPAEPLTVAGDAKQLFAAQRIPTSSKEVVFYLVGSISSPAESEVEPPTP